MNIGVDIGGTSIKIGLVNSKMEILKKTEIPTESEKGYEYIQNRIINAIEELIGSTYQNITNIGIGVPGIGDNNFDYVYYCVNLGWKNVPIGKDLKSYFSIPVYIENDATCAVIAERELGVANGAQNIIMITLGTGVGGGIIINGKIFKGSHGVGSEIGHMIIGNNFYDCSCGLNGCFETFVSATAIIKYTKKLLEETKNNSILMNNIDNNLNKLTAKIIFDSAIEGDDIAKEAVNRFVKYLSLGIANLTNILDPDLFVIGGGISKVGDYLIKKIEKKYLQYVLHNYTKMPDIKIAKMGNDAGIIGASLLEKYI